MVLNVAGLFYACMNIYDVCDVKVPSQVVRIGWVSGIVEQKFESLHKLKRFPIESVLLLGVSTLYFSISSLHVNPTIDCKVFCFKCFHISDFGYVLSLES